MVSTALNRYQDTIVVNGPSGLRLVRPGGLRATLARMRSESLDKRLARGESPESGVLLAVRARQLTSPEARHRLAGHWDALASRARRPRPTLEVRAPLARGQILDAAVHIEAVVAILRSSRPVTARGVALVAELITSAASPAFCVGASTDTLAEALICALFEL